MAPDRRHSFQILKDEELIWKVHKEEERLEGRGNKNSPGVHGTTRTSIMV